MKLNSNLIELKKGSLRIFIDPAGPNWISCNEAGAEIIRGRVIGDSSELTDFILRLKEEGFLDEANKTGYPGRAMVIETKRLSELWIYTNNSCNLRCKHCLVSAGEGNKDSLSAADIMRIVDEAKSLGVRRFYFTGGEPFLRHDIFTLINYITKDRELVILTNGTLITKEKAEKLALIDSKKLFLQISLEGHDAATHDSVRGKGSFEPAANGIKNLIEAGIAPTITTTITRLNMDSAVSTHRFIASLGINAHHILYLHPKGRMQRFRDELYISSDELSETMQRLIEASKETGVIIDNAESFNVRVSGKRGRKTDLCNCCYEMLCVDSDGEVYPCAAIAGDNRFSAGNARDYSLADLWLDSPLAKKIRQCSLNKIEKCRECYLRFICGGGCFCYGYFNEEAKTGAGRLESVDPYCETYKMLIENAIWVQAEKGVDKESLNKKTPVIYNSMGSETSACSISSVKQINPDYEAAGYHCSCVLSV